MGAAKSAVVTKPVTNKFSRNATYIMEPVDNAIKETLAKKYPNITLEIEGLPNIHRYK